MVHQAAVIGLGNIGFKFSSDNKRKGTWTHVDAYTRCPATTLVGAVEIDKVTIQSFHSRFPDIPVYSTVNELFTAQSVDIISICVPTSLHYRVFKEIIGHNVKAIFCEKPLAGSAVQSREMVNLARKSKILLAVNYTRRWQNSFIQVKDLVNSGKIGKVRVVTAYYSGQIFNIGSHLFDTVRMVSGIHPIEVCAITTESGPDPSVSGWMACDQGIFFSFISTGKREDLVFEIDIIGSDGRIKISENGEKTESYTFQESPRYSPYRELIPEKIKKPVKNDRFVDAVTNITAVLDKKSSNLLCSGTDGLAVDIMIDGVISAAKSQGRQAFCWWED